MNEHQQRIIWLLRNKPATVFKHLKPKAPRQEGFVAWSAKQPTPKKRIAAASVSVPPAVVAAAAEVMNKLRRTNSETPTAPPKNHPMSGYRYLRDSFGRDIARCEKCWLGFVIDDERAGKRMVLHNQIAHEHPQSRR